MIKFLLSQLPNSVFNYLDQLLKEEELRRNKDSSIYTSSYKDNKIEIRTEKSYLSTWSIYDDRGKEIIVEKDDFYYSIGEAEKAAINWLDSQEKGNV